MTTLLTIIMLCGVGLVLLAWAKVRLLLSGVVVAIGSMLFVAIVFLCLLGLRYGLQRVISWLTLGLVRQYHPLPQRTSQRRQHRRRRRF